MQHYWHIPKSWRTLKRSIDELFLSIFMSQNDKITKWTTGRLANHISRRGGFSGEQGGSWPTNQEKIKICVYTVYYKLI